MLLVKVHTKMGRPWGLSDLFGFFKSGVAEVISLMVTLYCSDQICVPEVDFHKVLLCCILSFVC